MTHDERESALECEREMQSSAEFTERGREKVKVE